MTGEIQGSKKRTQTTSSTPPSNEPMKDEALLYAKSLLRKSESDFYIKC